MWKEADYTKKRFLGPAIVLMDASKVGNPLAQMSGARIAALSCKHHVSPVIHTHGGGEDVMPRTIAAMSTFVGRTSVKHSRSQQRGIN